MALLSKRPLGDLEVPVVGLGCNNFGARYFNYVGLSGTRLVVDAAIDRGVTFLDTADVYGDCEQFLGRILKGRRDRVIIATKFGRRLEGEVPYDASPAWIRSCIESSLPHLQT